MIDVRRAGDRFTTRADWLTSRHSFSFGAHYDPENVGFAALVAHNDDVVASGAGYDTHPHADTEILTWVLEGSLVHRDSLGGSHLLAPGAVQLLSAGAGVLHSERNDAPGVKAPTRFVQMWVRPDESGLTPSYARAEVPEGDGLVRMASGIGRLDAPVRIHTSGSALHVSRMSRGQALTLPEAPRIHLFVARGSVGLEGAGRLDEGDAVRLSDEGGRSLSAGDAGEVLVFQMPAPSR